MYQYLCSLQNRSLQKIPRRDTPIKIFAHKDIVIKCTLLGTIDRKNGTWKPTDATIMSLFLTSNSYRNFTS